MALGDRDQLVTLEVPNGSAGYLPLNPATWYCHVRDDGSGQVTLMAGEYHPGITTATRVHHKGRTYHVDAIENRDARDTELILSCHEVFE